MFSKDKEPRNIDSPSETLIQGATPYKVIEEYSNIFYFDNQRFSSLEITLNYAHKFGYKVVGTTSDRKIIMELKV